MPFRRLTRGALFAVFAAFAGFVAAAHADPAFDLERYRGKVVLVDFWASWCKPCRQSFPWLNEMQSKYGADGLAIVGINVDSQRADAARFLGDVPARFEIVYDPAGAIAAHYDLMGMPSSLLFDRSGRLVTRHVGFRVSDRAARETELRELLASPPATRSASTATKGESE